MFWFDVCQLPTRGYVVFSERTWKGLSKEAKKHYNDWQWESQYFDKHEWDGNGNVLL